MCGIFVLLNNNYTFKNKDIIETFKKGVNRGPEYSELIQLNKYESIMFGFHRLAINGLNKEANQPMTIGNIVLICNGEIYNYKELYEKLEMQPTTDSDCEIIIHLYKRYGMEYTLHLLDGVFAFALYDDGADFNRDSLLYIARDPYGERPLYSMIKKVKRTDNVILNYMNESVIGFSSEIKVFTDLFNSPMYYDSTAKIYHVEPGSYMTYMVENSEWTLKKSARYHNFVFNTGLLEPRKNLINYSKINDHDSVENRLYRGICIFLNKAIEKRIVGTTDRQIACLLSGGLDSSIIAALVARYYKGAGIVLETYSIGMEGSEDLKYAQMVADHIGSKHTSVVVTEDDFFNAIPEVIEVIESYDTTTVRASVGNYLLGKYIKQHSKAKVIFNGDGSDELTGGYLYLQEAPDDLEFDRECKRLLTDIHAFDVLRSDKCISSHGLEPRTPFLDRAWVNYYLSIPSSLRNHANNPADKEIEKHCLRFAFSLYEPEILPLEILWRKKEAFSDGVSGANKSWYQVIQERLKTCSDYDIDASDDEVDKYHNHNIPTTKEQRYYRNIYDKLYPNTANVVPYLWMPKYVKASDPSARTLKIYKPENQ